MPTIENVELPSRVPVETQKTNNQHKNQHTNNTNKQHTQQKTNKTTTTNKHTKHTKNKQQSKQQLYQTKNKNNTTNQTTTKPNNTTKHKNKHNNNKPNKQTKTKNTIRGGHPERWGRRPPPFLMGVPEAPTHNANTWNLQCSALSRRPELTRRAVAASAGLSRESGSQRHTAA